MLPEERMRGKRSFIKATYNNPQIQEKMRLIVNCHAKSCYLCRLRQVQDCFEKWTLAVIRKAWELHGEELEKMRNEMVDDGTIEELKTKGHPTPGSSRPVPSVEEFIDGQHEKDMKKIEKINKAHKKGDINLLKEAVGGKEK